MPEFGLFSGFTKIERNTLQSGRLAKKTQRKSLAELERTTYRNKESDKIYDRPHGSNQTVLYSDCIVFL